MSINNYMRRKCNQVAVYWGNPTTNADGIRMYDLPKEIKCLWREGSEMIILRTGREVASLASVYVLEDLDEGGMLWLGTLNDLYQLEKQDPREIPNAYEIQPSFKTPSIAMQNQYVRKIMLGNATI